MSMKNTLTPAGIEPATFRLVARHLNHCATAVPQIVLVALDYCVWSNKGWSLLQLLVFRNSLEPNSWNLAVSENCSRLGYYATCSGNSLPTFRESCPKTSVRNYNFALRNNPEESSSYRPRGGRLKSRRVYWSTHGSLDMSQDGALRLWGNEIQLIN